MRRRICSAPAVTLASLLAVASLVPPVIQGQGSAGKIQGRVVSASGQPIASAQVTVDGTGIGNITNDDGYYFMNNVTAGLHTIRAQSIGFRTVAAAGQRVLAGQTMTLDFTLEQTAVELDALVITGDRNPLVPRDQMATKGIISGDVIASMPIDRVASMILLGPGVVDTNAGVSIRGAREGEHAVYVDGVPVRNLRTGANSNLDLPTNSLAQVDVTTGTVSARYGNAQSGLVNYVTRTGGASFGGMLGFRTDDLAPSQWRTGFNRLELSMGGPLPLRNVSFFAGGTAEGKRYRTMSQRFNHLTVYVPSGVDTVFRIARQAQTIGGFDSVDVVIPTYEVWDHGPTSPSQVSDNYNITAKLSYGLGRGSKIDLTWYRNRAQSLDRGWLSGLLNADSWTGSYTLQNTVTLGGYFLLEQSADRAIALDVKASYQRDWSQGGSVVQDYLRDHLSPPLGFNFEAIDFVMRPSEWPANRRLVNASRSGHLPVSEQVMLPERADLTRRQGVEGLSDVLRINPYGLRNLEYFSISGPGNVMQSWSSERRWYATATVDWQMNRFNRLWLGGEVTIAAAASRTIPLYQNRGYPYLFDPLVAGIFVQDRIDLGDVVLEAGLRADYFDPSGEFPRIPGFVFNVPDSLRKDMWSIIEGEGSVLERMVLTEDCGGAATVAKRTNPAGEVVCKNNFIPTKTRATINPKLAVSFPVTAASTFRLSYGKSAQPPRLNALLSSSEEDLASGTANTNWAWGRDVQIPTSVAIEAGYRQVFGGNVVIDASIYSRNGRNALSYRKLPFKDPNEYSDIYLNVLQNADFSLSRGVDLTYDQRVSELLDVGFRYSFVDARGTGSDPYTYINLIARHNSNLAIITGNPIEAPEVLLPLDQSRAHNLRGMISLSFGDRFQEYGSLARALLGDLAVFATMRIASGLPYTRLENNGDGYYGPPGTAGLTGTAIEPINASRTPMEQRFDLRLIKGFHLFGRGARISADFRNPLGLVNRDLVWLETGNDKNAVHRDKFVRSMMDDGLLFGAQFNADGIINIRSELEKNSPINRYMLLQAEQRFGDGDGMLSRAEAVRLITDLYNLRWGQANFRESDRFLRLGFEVVF